MIDVQERPAPGPAEAPAWRHKDLLDTDVLSRADIDLVMETADAMLEVRSRPVAKVASTRSAKWARSWSSWP